MHDVIETTSDPSSPRTDQTLNSSSVINALQPTNPNSRSIELIMQNQSGPLIVGCVASTLIYLILNADCKINPGKKDCSNNISPLISIPAGVGVATSLVGVHLERNCPQLYQRMRNNWATLIDFFSIRRGQNSQTQTPVPTPALITANIVFPSPPAQNNIRSN